MNEEEKMFRAAVDAIRQSAILELSVWSGLGGVKYRGTIVTEGRVVYDYGYYSPILDGTPSGDYTFIKRKTRLKQEDYDKLTEFIEANIINKEYEDRKVMDSSVKLTVNYNGVHKEILNNSGIDGENGIYDETEEFIKKLTEPMVQDNN